MKEIIIGDNVQRIDSKNGIWFKLPDRDIIVSALADGDFGFVFKIKSEDPEPTVLHDYTDGEHTVKLRLTKTGAELMLIALAEQI